MIIPFEQEDHVLNIDTFKSRTVDASQSREPIERPVQFISIPNHQSDLDKHKDYAASLCKAANFMIIGEVVS